MIRLAVAGDQSGPDARLDRAAVETVVKLKQLRREAIALITKELPSSDTPIDPAAVSIRGRISADHEIGHASGSSGDLGSLESHLLMRLDGNQLLA